MRQTALLSILVLASALGACKKPPAKQHAEAPVDSSSEPNHSDRVEATFTEGQTVDFWMSDTLAWRLRSKTLRQDPESDRVWAKPVDLVAYNKNGTVNAHVTSDSGAMDKAMRFFRAWGHVVAGSKKGMELRADSIIFDKESNQIHTASRVRVKTESGDVLTGRGFRSDANLNNWEILSDVRGSIQDLGSLPFKLP
jgi:LPS export ABC transporter protein LptC